MSYRDKVHTLRKWVIDLQFADGFNPTVSEISPNLTTLKFNIVGELGYQDLGRLIQQLRIIEQEAKKR